MQTRSGIIDDFLTRSGWDGARRESLAGDASFRRYERIFLAGKQAVLMDAPPEKEDVRPFMHIGGYLSGLGLSAPRIHAHDQENGLLLLEDLGDSLFARVLEHQPKMEEELYRAAVEALAHLHMCARSDAKLSIPIYDMPRFMSQVALLPEWFLPLFIEDRQKLMMLEAEYREAWNLALKQLPDMERVPVLYDFHAENILWLPERQGVERAGLLDFQDAVWGSPAYDMVSLLEDARRDVSSAVADRMIAHYLERTSASCEDFKIAYALLGAQRNSRIVGTFARLALRDGKKQYLAYLPRVWRHLENDMSHPLLGELKSWMDRNVPQEWRIALDPVGLKKKASA